MLVSSCSDVILFAACDLSIPSLCLLVPTLRLMCAFAWKVIQSGNVPHYRKVEELVVLVTELSPQLLTARERVQLLLRLRARVTTATSYCFLPRIHRSETQQWALLYLRFCFSLCWSCVRVGARRTCWTSNLTWGSFRISRWTLTAVRRFVGGFYFIHISFLFVWLLISHKTREHVTFWLRWLWPKLAHINYKNKKHDRTRSPVWLLISITTISHRIQIKWLSFSKICRVSYKWRWI